MDLHCQFCNINSPIHADDCPLIAPYPDKVIWNEENKQALKKRKQKNVNRRTHSNIK